MELFNFSNKVFILINSLSTGGAESVVKRFYSHDPENIIIITLMKSTRKIPHIELSKVKSPLIMWLFFPLYVLRLKKVIKKYNPKAIYSFLEFSNFISIIATKGFNTKSIISIGAHLSSIYRKGIYGIVNRYLIRNLYPKAYKLVTNSKLLVKDLKEKFNCPEKKITVIYNPLDIDKIRKQANEPIENKYKPLFDNPTIINCGRLDKSKNQENLILAFKIVLEEFPNAKLIILGEGSRRKRLEKLIRKNKLNNKVILFGNVENPQKYISKASIFAFSSLYEGFPNALLEALACSKAVISTDCPSGPREILAPDTPFTKSTKTIEKAEYGLLTPVMKTQKDIKTYASAIIMMLKDKKMRENYEKKALTRAKEFPVEKQYKQYLILNHYKVSLK